MLTTPHYEWGAGKEVLHTVVGLLQIGMALPVGLVRHSSSRSGDPPPPLLGEGKVLTLSYMFQSKAVAQKNNHLRSDHCWGPLLRDSSLSRA